MSATRPSDEPGPDAGSTPSPTIGVLALQGAFALHRSALERCGAATVEVRQPAHLDGLDGLVIPGGESTTMVKLMVAFDLVDPLTKLIDGGLPVFGTCAGMILLATDVLDGHVTSDGQPDQLCFAAMDIDVRRNGYGRQIDSFEAELELGNRWPPALDGAVPVGVFIRAPVVERVGEAVEVLATVDERPVLLREGSVLVSSFHPELTGDDRIHRLFLDNMVPAAPTEAGRPDGAVD